MSFHVGIDPVFGNVAVYNEEANKTLKLEINKGKILENFIQPRLRIL